MTKFAVVGTDHLHVVELVSGLRRRRRGARRDRARPTIASVPWLASQYRTRAHRDPTSMTRSTASTSSSPPRSRRPRRDRHRRDARRQGRRSPTSPARRPSNSSTRCAPRTRRRAAGTRAVLGAAHERGDGARAATRRRPAASATVVHTVGLGPHTLNLKQRPRVVLRPGALRRDPRRHRLAPGRPVPRVHRRDARRGARVDRACRTPSIPGVAGARRDAARGRRRDRLRAGRLLHARRASRRRGATCASPSSAPRATSRCATSTRRVLVVDGERAGDDRLHRASPSAGATRYLAGTLVDPGARVRGDRDLPRRPGRRPARRIGPGCRRLDGCPE